MEGLMRSIINFLKSMLKKKSLECYVISHKPIILITYWFDFLRNQSEIFKTIPHNRNVYFLFQSGWYKDKRDVDKIQKEIAIFRNIYPKTKYIFLSNSIEENEFFLENNLTSIFCNQNAFIDEKRYKIKSRIEKKYDAIYLARITPFKRHELAVKVKNLLLIGSFTQNEEEHYQHIMKILPDAKWIEKVFSFRVSQYMNQAKVGLCLSAIEGAMFVSAEYLLSGIPIVSTISVGGRDALFDTEFVKIVKDNSESVAKGVEEMIKKDINPEYIRRETIKKMIEHREKFFNLVQEIYDKEMINRKFKDDWKKVFVHKMGLRCGVGFNTYKKKILKKGFILKNLKLDYSV